MRKALLFAIAALMIGGITVPQELSDAEIRKILIERSIRSYSGSCPCPYSTARNGSRCGGRSAYSRPGGASPLCFDRDVTDDMIQRYRDQNKK